MTTLLFLRAVLSTATAAAIDECRPWEITDNSDGGCGKWFPRFHPKNTRPLAHNNDANAPFEYNGMHHLMMQASLPGVSEYNGAIGLGHIASPDLATWIPVQPALVPGRTCLHAAKTRRT